MLSCSCFSSTCKAETSMYSTQDFLHLSCNLFINEKTYSVNMIILTIPPIFLEMKTPLGIFACSHIIFPKGGATVCNYSSPLKWILLDKLRWAWNSILIFLESQGARKNKLSASFPPPFFNFLKLEVAYSRGLCGALMEKNSCWKTRLVKRGDCDSSSS